MAGSNITPNLKTDAATRQFQPFTENKILNIYDYNNVILKNASSEQSQYINNNYNKKQIKQTFIKK